MYNFYLGGGYTGERLNKLYKESVGEEEILKDLEELFEKYAKSRLADEHFGDFCVRTQVVAA
jgi:sulfite reductase (NADPH) hemoprotein beta-component